MEDYRMGFIQWILTVGRRNLLAVLIPPFVNFGVFVNITDLFQENIIVAIGTILTILLIDVIVFLYVRGEFKKRK